MKTNYLLALFVFFLLFFSTLRAEEGKVPSDLSEVTKMENKELEEHKQMRPVEYQLRPKRKFVGPGNKNKQYDDYINNWRQNVERIANQSYPLENYSLQSKNGKLYESITVTVSIKSDGELEAVLINKSSGSKLLDANVKDAIIRSSPFEPFGDEMKKSVDILSITKIWTFINKYKIQ